VQPEVGPREKVRLKEGTLVCFDEIYIAEIGNEKLGKMVKEREEYWAAKTGRRDLAALRALRRPPGQGCSHGLEGHGPAHDMAHHSRVRGAHQGDPGHVRRRPFRVAGDRCTKFVWEIKQWRADEQTGKQIDRTTTPCRTSATPSPTSRRCGERC
jgi:hypothetical protein